MSRRRRSTSGRSQSRSSSISCGHWSLWLRCRSLAPALGLGGAAGTLGWRWRRSPSSRSSSPWSTRPTRQPRRTSSLRHAPGSSPPEACSPSPLPDSGRGSASPLSPRSGGRVLSRPRSTTRAPPPSPGSWPCFPCSPRSRCYGPVRRCKGRPRRASSPSGRSKLSATSPIPCTCGTGLSSSSCRSWSVN